MRELSKSLIIKVSSADKRLNENSVSSSNDIERYVNALLSTGAIEVGWRSQCGSTHNTQKVYREWGKIVKALIKDGFDITEEAVKHKNAYATNNGGFWDSTIYKLKQK